MEENSGFDVPKTTGFLSISQPQLPPYSFSEFEIAL
jgi:hypothetical protein